MGKSNTKPGPKLQPGDRYLSGDLKPYDRGGGPPVSQIRRIVEKALRGAADPLLGSVVGYHLLLKAITAEQAAAAEAYGKIRGRYDRAMGLPRRSVASPTYGAAMSRGSARELSEKGLSSLKSEHADLLSAVGSSQAMVERFCVDEQHPMVSDLPAICAALNRVGRHLKLRG